MIDLSPEDMTALISSLRVALCATETSLPITVLVALALARGRFPGRRLFDTLVHLPRVLPPVATGYILLVTFGRKGPIGHALESCCSVVLSFRWTGAVLAAAVKHYEGPLHPV